MDIQIKRLAAEDIAVTNDLVHIMIGAWQSGFRNILPDSIIEKYTRFDPCADMFRQIIASGTGTMYLARLNGKSVGLLYWIPEEETARIEALLTIPEVWGKGVAAALMEQVLADTISFHAVTVWPFAENKRALRFYEKHGFSPSGHSRMGDSKEVEYLRTNATI